MSTAQTQPPGSAGRENFVSRLYQMLSAPEFADIVSWNSTDQGPSFVIFDTAKFQDQVLVNEFNHANFSSFVRQLNKYDFHKVKFRDSHSRIWEFQHPFFRPENRDKPYLIKRKQQSGNRRAKRSDSVIKEQADVAVKAAKMAASNTEELLSSQVSSLESRVQTLEESNMQFLSALKMQHRLVERLLRAANLPDEDDVSLSQSMGASSNSLSGQPMSRSMGQSMPADMGVATMGQSPIDHPMDQSGQSMQYSSPMVSEYMVSTNQTPTVLMGVDDAKVRDVLLKLLGKGGFHVESVENGVDVVQKVETGSYNFILIDSILKGLDGLSAVELIRQSNTYTPIILMSDTDSDEEHEAYLARGITSVLYRPFNQSDLFKALQYK